MKGGGDGRASFKVKANLILEHTADDALLKATSPPLFLTPKATSTSRRVYYAENPMPPTTEQAVIMLSSHFYESGTAARATSFADNTGAAQQVWNTVNLLLRLDRRWQV